MSQLIENKQNGTVLIENFEPTHCARKSAQKVEVQVRRRRLCALCECTQDESSRIHGAKKVESGSRVGGTKKTGRAEALPVSFINFVQPNFTFSDGRLPSSTAWWLRASWTSLGFSLPCSCFLQFWCVQTVALTENLQPVSACLHESRQRLGGFELLGLLKDFLCHVLVSSVFFGRPPCLADAGHYAS
jgi:hypothetical protein